MLRHAGRPATNVKDFVLQFAPLDQPEKIRSSHALDFLADIMGESKEVDNAARVLDLLAETYDPIRKNYWAYRKEQLASV